MMPMNNDCFEFMKSLRDYNHDGFEKSHQRAHGWAFYDFNNHDSVYFSCLQDQSKAHHY